MPLIVGVADTTLRHDRDVKIPPYARNATPEAWLIDLAGRAMHVFRAPAQGACSEIMTIRSAGLQNLSALHEVSVDSSDPMTP